MKNKQSGQSTVISIYNELRLAITRGELTEGSQLKQAALGKRFGVSKIPVREALAKLAGDGFVTLDTGRGATVAGLSAAEAREIYLIRLALEPILLRDSLPNLDLLTLARAEALRMTINSLPEIDPYEWHALDREFHDLLYQGAPHERMKALVSALHDNLARYFVIYDAYGPTFRAESDAEHLLMLEACKRNDIDAAVGYLRENLAKGSAALLTILRERER